MKPPRLDADALAQIDRALRFFLDACQSDNSVNLLASGRIAYALHNGPAKLRKAQQTKTGVFRHPGLKLGGPEEVEQSCEQFFSQALSPERFVTPSPLSESLLEQLNTLFQVFRFWWLGGENQTVGEIIDKVGQEHWTRARQQCLTLALETQAEFISWLETPPDEHHDRKP